MLSPDYIYQLADGAEELASELHAQIIAKIISRILIRLERDEDYILTPVDKWQLETLQAAGVLMEDIQSEIAKSTNYQQEAIKQAFEDAAVVNLEYDDAVYVAAGLSPTPLKKSPYMIRLLQRGYEKTLGTFKNLTGTIADAAQQLFIKECDNAYSLVASGAMSYTEAVKDAVDRIVKDGVKVEYTRPNPITGQKEVYHTDTIETATLRCVRTGVSQATAEITNARMDEMEWDIVLVSSHLGARVTDANDFTNHAWWQGKFYSRSGKDKKFPPFSVCGQGDVQGINGANCRHSYGPGDGINNPFEHYDSEENRKAYELSQRQRELERRIRKTKREVLDYRTAANDAKSPELKEQFEAKYQQKAVLLQKQNAAYNKFCQDNDRKRLQDRLSIAGWGRKEAAAATGAARKYNPIKSRSKPTTIEDINKKATESLLDAYEQNRVRFNLKLASADELRVSKINPITANFNGVSIETAKAFADTISKLSKQYYTGITSIEVQDPKKVFGAIHFAQVNIQNLVGRRTLFLNPFKTKDYDKMVNRITELSNSGYCVRIKKGLEREYIATHEFAHTLFDMNSPLKNYVGKDIKFEKKVRTEIAALYDKYLAEVRNIENERKNLEMEFIMGIVDQNRANEIRERLALLKSAKISDYSMVNADEFMAEAFTEYHIGETPSKYAVEVMQVIDKYFRR